MIILLTTIVVSITCSKKTILVFLYRGNQALINYPFRNNFVSISCVLSQGVNSHLW